MANSYGQFTGWVSVSHISKCEPSCTSHERRASFQRWQVHRGLVHGICPHAATQSYMDENCVKICDIVLFLENNPFYPRNDQWYQYYHNSFILKCILTICIIVTEKDLLEKNLKRQCNKTPSKIYGGQGYYAAPYYLTWPLLAIS